MKATLELRLHACTWDNSFAKGFEYHQKTLVMIKGKPQRKRAALGLGVFVRGFKAIRFLQ
jgi:hypothetical protein